MPEEWVSRASISLRVDLQFGGVMMILDGFERSL